MTLKSEYAGVWQDAEGTKTSTGILEVNKQGLKLKLIGIHGIKEDEGQELKGGPLSGVRVKPFDLFAETQDISNLFSRAIGGKCVSLFGLTVSHSNSIIFAPPEEKYFEFRAKYGLFGKRCVLDNLEEVFYRSRYHIADLHKFSSGRRFSKEQDEQYENKKMHILDDGDSDTFNVPEKNIKFILYNGYSEANDEYYIKLNYLTTLTIESNEGINIETHLRYFGRFNLLLEFLRGSKTIINNTYFITGNIEKEQGDARIYEEFEFVSNKGYHPEDKLKDSSLVISLRSLDNREEIVHSWMIREDGVPRLISWFNYLWQNESYLVESQLVEYASLLEIISTSNQSKRKFLSNKEFKPILDDLKNCIPNNISDDVTKIFTAYLERMNTKSQRLGIESLVSIIWIYFSSTTDFTCADFSKAISVNRNNISHGNYNSTGTCAAKSVEAIFYLKEFCKYITYTLLAKSIGIPEEIISNTIIERFKQKQYHGKLKRSDFY